MIALLRERAPFAITGTGLALAGVLLLALALRVYGWNWDDGNYLHPDERHIVSDVMIGRIHWPSSLGELVDPATSGLNPRSAEPGIKEVRFREFAYGAMPVLLTNLISEVLGWFTDTNWHAYDHAYKVGRPLSALIDTLTVLLVYFIGRRLVGARAGLIAAYVAGVTPLTVQLAHYFTTDSWLTFFVTLSLYASIRAAESEAARWFLLAGAAFGWAMACKGSVFTLATVLGAALLYTLWRQYRGGERGIDVGIAAAERLAFTGGAALVAFAMFEPYALLRPDVYRASLQTQAEIVRGLFDVPFTRQYIGTTPILYQIEQLFRWEVGPVAFLFASFGLVLLIVRQRRALQAGAVVLLTWLAVYGVVISVPEAKFIRYLAPIVPVVAVLAGMALDALWSRLSSLVNGRAGSVVAAVVIAGIGFWGASFVSIYAQPNTRLEASAWIYANVPTGSVLSDEYWDDQLPRDLGPGLNSNDVQYSSVRFNLYADYVSYRDLVDVGSHVAALPLLDNAGALLQAGDVGGSADEFRNVGPLAIQLPFEDRDRLSSGFNRVADGMRGPAGTLGGAFREAARAIRDDPEAVPVRFAGIANELIAANDNEAANYLYRNLQEIDYYVISSNRVMSAMPRSPWRYPVQTAFYDALESGELGFELVAEFYRYPGIGPLRFDDDGADESWLNYDHPHVWIYQKTGLIDRPAYDALMLGARMQQVTPQRYPETGDDLMLDGPVGDQPVVDDARWSARWTDNSAVALVVWLALLAVLQAAAWPWARLLFGRFADGGWSFSRLLALLISGYLVWLGASTAILSFRAVWAWVAVLLLAAVGWILRLRWTAFRPGWRQSAAQRRVALAAEVVFWVVFGVFLLFRYQNPDSYHPIWGGEKPMEFAHLNATLRSAHFPPYDPWFADGYINYYYFGLYLVAFCLKLTGIPSEIGFNLAQPMILALLAMVGFGVASTLGRDLVRRGLAIPAGLAGSLLLVGIGNLDEFFRWLEQPEVRDFGYNTWGPTRMISEGGTITEFPFFTGLYADLHAHAVALPITVLAIGLAYALARDARRNALALARPRSHRSAAVALILRCLTLSLTVGALFATNAWDVATYAALGGAGIFMATAAVHPLPRRLAATAGIGVAFGALAYALFLPFHQRYVALFTEIAEVRGPSDFWEFGRHIGGLLAIVAIGLISLMIRRLDERRRGDAVGWSSSAVTLLMLGAIGLHGVLPSDQQELRDAMTTLTAAVAIVALIGSVWIGAPGERVGRRPDLLLFLRVGTGLVGIAALICVATDRVVLGVMLAVAAQAAAVWMIDEDRAARFVALMCTAAASVSAGTEVIFLADNLQGGAAYRMNTVFKFYNQVWVLLALSGGVLLSWMAATWLQGNRSNREPAAVGFADLPTDADPGSSNPPAALQTGRGRQVEHDDGSSALLGWVQTGAIAGAAVIAISLFYPVLATGPRLEQRFADHLGSGTLDANDWMDYGTISTAPDRTPLRFADDRAAIDWFNSEVPGSPVIAEASIDQYRCNGSRISNATGLPTIIGWYNHQTQQRYVDGLGTRVNDVAELYRTTDIAMKELIIQRYGVEYVVVGSLERLGITQTELGCTARPNTAGIAAFEQMVGTTLEVAFEYGETTVYRVIAEPADSGS